MDMICDNEHKIMSGTQKELLSFLFLFIIIRAIIIIITVSQNSIVRGAVDIIKITMLYS